MEYLLCPTFSVEFFHLYGHIPYKLTTYVR